MNTPLTLASINPYLLSLRDQNILTDFILNVSGISFPAHRIILISNSDYFRVLLLGEFQEAGLNQVDIETTDPNIFERVLNLIYGQTVTFEYWRQKLDTLVLLKFFLINTVDFVEAVCQVNVPQEESLAYFPYLEYIFDSNIPEEVYLCVGGMITSNETLEMIPEKYREELVDPSNNPVDIIRLRLEQRAAQQSYKPIQYFIYESEEITPLQADFGNKIFSGRSKEEVLLKLADVISPQPPYGRIPAEILDVLGESGFIFDKEVIEDYQIEVLGENVVLNRYDIESIDKLLDRLIEVYTDGEFYLIPVETI